VGAASQVVVGGDELLQRFPGDLDFLRLRVERFFHVVVTVAILSRLSNLFVRCSGRDAMWNMGSHPTHGGDQVCGFLAGRPVVVLFHGLELPSEHGA
jgi:hypothetical protein